MRHQRRDRSIVAAELGTRLGIGRRIVAQREHRQHCGGDPDREREPHHVAALVLAGARRVLVRFVVVAFVRVVELFGQRLGEPDLLESARGSDGGIDHLARLVGRELAVQRGPQRGGLGRIDGRDAVLSGLAQRVGQHAVFGVHGVNPFAPRHFRRSASPR